jgi:hypothetical protein
MLPFLLVPFALAFGLVVSDSPAQPPVAAPIDSTVVDTTDAEPSTGPAVIQFENQGFEMATVYVVPQSGMPYRIGRVMSGNTARLVVPRSVVGGPTTVQIIAVPFATGRRVSSGPVQLAQGEALRASLASSANLLSVLPVR